MAAQVAVLIHFQVFQCSGVVIQALTQPFQLVQLPKAYARVVFFNGHTIKEFWAILSTLFMSRCAHNWPRYAASCLS